MARRNSDLPFAPFGKLIAKQCALRAVEDQAGYSALADELGFDESQMRRWAVGIYRERQRGGGALVEKRFERISLDVVDRVTTGLGIRIDELYPELDVDLEPEAWCAACGEQVTPVQGVCPWCERRVAGTVRPDPVRTLVPRAPSPKVGTGAATRMTADLVRAAMAAYIEDPCYLRAARAVEQETEHPYASAVHFSNAIRNHFVRRGWWTPDDVRRALDGDVMARPVPYRGKLSPELLTRGRELYEQGMGFQRIARELHEGSGAASVSSLSNSINHAFRHYGWPIRDRVEATRLASWRHGRATRDRDAGSYRRWFRTEHGLYQPRCQGTIKGGTLPSRAGEQCTKPAMQGEAFCAQHHPERVGRDREQLARMRATAAANRGGLLPAEPIAAWIRALCDEHGSRVVRERLELSPSRLSQLRVCKAPVISRRRAGELLAAWGAGESVEDLWPLTVVDGGAQAPEPEAVAA